MCPLRNLLLLLAFALALVLQLSLLVALAALRAVLGKDTLATLSIHVSNILWGFRREGGCLGTDFVQEVTLIALAAGDAPGAAVLLGIRAALLGTALAAPVPVGVCLNNKQISDNPKSQVVEVFASIRKRVRNSLRGTRGTAHSMSSCVPIHRWWGWPGHPGPGGRQ
jgi:hypothetical protein